MTKIKITMAPRCVGKSRAAEINATIVKLREAGIEVVGAVKQLSVAINGRVKFASINELESLEVATATTDEKKLKQKSWVKFQNNFKGRQR